MISPAEIYVWLIENKWWLVMAVPFVIVIFFIRSASVR